MEIKKYKPAIIESIPLVDEGSLWQNISTILKDIIVRFNLKTDLALEFGTYWGCSASALAHYWKKVITVDPFMGNEESARYEMYYKVMKSLKHLPVSVIIGGYEEYIKNDLYDRYDIVHIDIIHSYEDTYASGEWAVQHSDCVIFHDTGIPRVRSAVRDIAEKFDMDFYNFEEGCWLGILVKKYVN